MAEPVASGPTVRTDRERLDRLRDEFPIVGRRAFLFSGGFAPAPRRATDAVARWMRLWSDDPSMAWEERFIATELVRDRLARLLGTTRLSVAVTENTSRASNVAVSLLEPRPGANVVVDVTTYPSSLYPWLPPVRAGIEVRRAGTGRAGLAASMADLESLVDERTVAISVSHVDPLSGVRHDLRPLADLAHAHRAVLIVDVAQSAGVVSLDISADGIDLATGTAMKWLLGPPGIGFLIVSPALLERSGAPHLGYLGGELDPDDPGRVRIDASARRHELGLPNMLGMPGFAAGLEIIDEARPKAIEAHVESLVGRILRGLELRGLSTSTPHEPALRAGLVVLPVRDARHLQGFLRDGGVDVWASERRGLIRVDPHFFNDEHDIDRCLAGLDAYVRTCGRDAIRAT